MLAPPHTIVVFSKDRRSHLHSIYRYYISSGFILLILDGTEGEACSLLANLCSESLQYIHMPGASIAERLFKASTLVESEYLTLVTDDDYFFAEGIRNTITYLARNPHIGSCGGQVRKLTRVNDHIVTYPWSHWTDVSYPDPAPSMGARLDRACQILARVETASFFYLTYKRHSFAMLTRLYTAIASLTPVLEILQHGSHELLFSLFNLLYCNTCILCYPFAFRGDALGVDTSEYIALINSGDDPKAEWFKPANIYYVRQLCSYLELIIKISGIKVHCPETYVTTMINCYMTQVKLGEALNPILISLNPYLLDPSYSRTILLRSLDADYNALNHYDLDVLRSELVNMEKTLLELGFGLDATY